MFIDVIVVVIIIGITLGIEYGSYNVMNTVGLAAYYFLYLYFAFVFCILLCGIRYSNRDINENGPFY